MHRAADWKQAPKNAVWWAIDADGKAYRFNAENVIAYTNFWFTEQVNAPRFNYEGDWRESLTKRPE